MKVRLREFVGERALLVSNIRSSSQRLSNLAASVG